MELKLSAVNLEQTTEMKANVSFITAHAAYAGTNKTENCWNLDGSLFFTRGGRASSLRACLTLRCFHSLINYPNLSEGAESVGGQLSGNKRHTPSIAFRHLPPKEGCRKPVLGVWIKECPFTGRVWIEEGAGNRCSECGQDAYSQRKQKQP